MSGCDRNIPVCVGIIIFAADKRLSALFPGNSIRSIPEMLKTVNGLFVSTLSQITVMAEEFESSFSFVGDVRS